MNTLKIPFFFFIELQEKKLNYDVHYQTSINGSSIGIMFPANVITRKFGSLSENYIIMQLAHTYKIFLNLKELYTNYPYAFKYRYGNQILVEMQELLNSNIESPIL